MSNYSKRFIYFTFKHDSLYHLPEWAYRVFIETYEKREGE